MGKQTCFFMSEADEKEFFELIESRGDVLLDVRARELPGDEAQQSLLSQVFVSLPRCSPILTSRGFVDEGDAEVIEFDLCGRQDARAIDEGRIWAEFRYYDTNDNPVRKSKQFEDLYSFYAKWIRKHYRISKDKRYYIADDAYLRYREDGWVMRDIAYRVEFD